MADGSTVTIRGRHQRRGSRSGRGRRGAATAAAQGVRVILFGPPTRSATSADGVEVVDAPVSIAKAADPAIAVRSTPDASIVQAARAVAEGRAQALVAAARPAPRWPPGLFNIRRASGIFRPALAMPLPIPGKPVTLLDVGANAESRPSTWCSSPSWARRSPRSCSASTSRASGCSPTARRP
jgi:fatty acid/phospholipid biosynthesis enzyme